MRWQMFYIARANFTHARLFADGEYLGTLRFRHREFDDFQTDFRFVEVFPEPQPGEAR